MRHAGAMLSGLTPEKLQGMASRSVNACEDRERKVRLRDPVTGARYETSLRNRQWRDRDLSVLPPCCWGDGVVPVIMQVEGYHESVTLLRCTCEASYRWQKRAPNGEKVPGQFWTASYWEVFGTTPPDRAQLEAAITRWLVGETLPEPPVSPSPPPERPRYADPPLSEEPIDSADPFSDRRSAEATTDSAETQQGDIWGPIGPELSDDAIRAMMSPNYGED